MASPTDAPDYGDRIAAEHRLFNETTDVHDLPGIYHYWSEKWILPKLRAFGIPDAIGLFENYLTGQCRRPGAHRRQFISIGAGNCDLEIELAGRLRHKGFNNFVIECLELNPAMLARGEETASRAGVGDNLIFVEGDMNRWKTDHLYDAVIASQSLHHVVALEELFERIQKALVPGGQFILSDIIGRNGHMRWPEALEIVHHFWKEMPPSYRYNRPLRRQEDVYDNWDCSAEGFEGIRAQDILPLLLRTFHFEIFIGFGNVILPFVDRAFGHNFDPAGQWDRDFIDRVHLRDESEMLAGRIKPTIAVAVLGTDTAVPTQYLAPFSPAFCVRWPDGPAEEAATSNPWLECPGLKRNLAVAEARERNAISQLADSLRTAQRQIQLAAESRWLRLGQRLGLGPKLR